MERVSAEKITDLKENEVFVFGSNTGGRHVRELQKWLMTDGELFTEFLKDSKENHTLSQLRMID